MVDPSLDAMMSEFQKNGGIIKKMLQSPIQTKVQKTVPALSRKGKPIGVIVTISVFENTDETVNILCLTNEENYFEEGETYSFHFRVVRGESDRGRIHVKSQKNPETKISYISETLPTLLNEEKRMHRVYEHSIK